MATKEEIVGVIKELLLATEKRNGCIDRCCPRFTNEQTIAEELATAAKVQIEISKHIKVFRSLTGSRYEEWLDGEIACLCHAWASIWSDEKELVVNSHNIANIVGKNKTKMLAQVIDRLLDGTSPLLRYMLISWENEPQGMGAYRLRIVDPYCLSMHILHSGDGKGKEG